jgi:hypothetical protein
MTIGLLVILVRLQRIGPFVGKRNYKPGPKAIYPKTLLVRMTVEMHQELKQMAINNDRDMAQEVRRAIDSAINRHYIELSREDYDQKSNR